MAKGSFDKFTRKKLFASLITEKRETTRAKYRKSRMYSKRADDVSKKFQVFLALLKRNLFENANNYSKVCLL